ncbi:hypothetical protein GCM10025863_04300 [Microbacterium suwonense]|uniref:acetylglutamate kinase n=1 Tax=Microbacterium suwonense TaxID=683047 RepID=A0ABN6X116_9MICO|nr:hypothetical protein GCM10025863_04300 [Microbacterium suwonense]
MTDLQLTAPEEAAVKAATLIESLPWLKRFRDQIVVVKYGGNAMVSEELQDAFAQDIAYLRYVGVQPVVVHGGGRRSRTCSTGSPSPASSRVATG